MPQPTRLACSHTPMWLLILSLAVIGATPVSADNFRVTTWDLGGLEPPILAATNARAQASFEAAVVGIRALNPDLILLRSVRDWQACQALAAALGTNSYHVIVCSSFPSEPVGGPWQLAILSKRKGYFSWSENWGGTSGMVFGAVQTGSQRVGFFLARHDPVSGRVNLEQRWSAAAAAVRGWTANRLDCIVVGLSVPPQAGETAMRQSGLVRESVEIARAAFPEHLVVTGGAGSLVTARLNANPATAPALIASHWPATFDLTVEPGQPTALLTVAGGADVSGGTRRLPDVLTQDSLRRRHPYAWADPYVSAALKLLTDHRAKPAAAVFAAVLVASFLWGLRALLHKKRKRRLENAARALLASQASTALLGSGSGLVPSGEAAERDAAQWRERALAAEAKAERALQLVKSNAGPALGELLQHAAVQKLIADRSSLLQTQSDAVLDARHLDERMARIEERLRQQSQSYEQRIRELEQDLAAAQQQSRALIQAKIHQLKAEMEAARARVIDEG